MPQHERSDLRDARRNAAMNGTVTENLKGFLRGLGYLDGIKRMNFTKPLI